MLFTYYPKGVCSRQIDIQTGEDGVVEEVSFASGCHGNLQGISSLVRGLQPEEIIQRLEGIDCRGKGTSCPDQLARALRQLQNRQATHEQASEDEK